MSQHSPTTDELEYLENGLKSETKTVNIRLREGEYQFDLAKVLASFELGLRFPDVKDLIKKLYGEEKTEDIQFVRKIQTILKKMEKSGIVRIVPKKKPWELQTYALSSFKFLDVEKNLVTLVTEPEVKKTLELIHSRQDPKQITAPHPTRMTTRILLLMFTVLVSYAAIVWTATQPTINSTVFVLAFSIAAASSILLGVSVSRKK